MGTTEVLIHTATSLATIALMIYGLLLVAGVPFNDSPQLANQYIRWLGRITIYTVELPFRLLFGRKRKKRKKRKGY